MVSPPSTLFAGLGGNMAQGLGIGFKEQMNQVARDMRNAIPTNFDTDINANMNVSGGGTSGTVINQSLSVTTPKPLSEREHAREFKIYRGSLR